ncbi:hypothetical protein LSAT2_014842 [Lamellibrachia satsuma]|nr:hypothetical protein LSAT2_014842 [Lamellibrachia satsuma]
MYKLRANGNTACYVTPLNHSEADPQTVRANMKKVDESSVDGSDSAIFYITEGAIKKPAFLGKTINMCSGVSIYWLSPKCSGNSSDLVEKPGSEADAKAPRHKRASLRCVMCGCYLLCAPRVAGISYYVGASLHCRLYYYGRPAYLYKLPAPCTRKLMLF